MQFPRVHAGLSGACSDKFPSCLYIYKFSRFFLIWKFLKKIFRNFFPTILEQMHFLKFDDVIIRFLKNFGEKTRACAVVLKMTYSGVHTLVIKNAKAKHFVHCFKKPSNKPHEMWKTINKLINKKSKTTIITKISTENGSFTYPKKVTNVLDEDVHQFNHLVM